MGDFSYREVVDRASACFVRAVGNSDSDKVEVNRDEGVHRFDL